jgi:hypothetical protein
MRKKLRITKIEKLKLWLAKKLLSQLSNLAAPRPEEIFDHEDLVDWARRHDYVPYPSEYVPNFIFKE